MNELTDILRAATCAIGQKYFHLEIDGGNDVYRERVYCYELYHQMRLRWPAHSDFYLNGEPDKAAHPLLKKLGADGLKPDLLVHRPGYMSGNQAVIEIKSANVTNAGIRKDIANLDLFVRTVGYQRAIYLFFGDEADARLVTKVKKNTDNFQEFAPIELWLHQEVGKPATHSATIQRIQ